MVFGIRLGLKGVPVFLLWGLCVYYKDTWNRGWRAWVEEPRFAPGLDPNTTYGYMHVYMYVNIYIYVCIYLYMYTHIYIYVYVCLYLSTYLSIYKQNLV